MLAKPRARRRASPDTYDMLVRIRGYTLDQYEQWIATSLTNVLLRPSPGSGAALEKNGATG